MTTHYSLLNGPKGMRDLPVELIEEIVSYVGLPQDLLSLSWTSKTFYSILMERRSDGYWKKALENHKCPPRPQELSERAWIALLFSPFCTACGKNKASKVFWALRMRLCTSCKSELLMDLHEYHRISTQEFLCFHWYPIAEGKCSRHDPPRILRSEFSKVTSTWVMYTQCDREDRDNEEWSAFYYEKSRRVRALHDFQTCCIRWYEDRDEQYKRLRGARVAEYDRLRDERLSQDTNVTDPKLKRFRWAPELKLLEQSNWDACRKLAYVPRLLNDCNLQNALHEMVQCMRILKEEHLASKWQRCLHRRWREFTTAGLWLVHQYLGEHPELRAYGFNLADLALTPEVRSIMLQPEDEPVGARDLMALRSGMNTIVEAWRSRVCSELRKSDIATAEFVKDPLELATTTFSCGTCGQACLFFPNVLAHTCQRPAVDSASGLAPKLDAYEQFVNRKNHMRGNIGHLDVGFALSLSLREYEPSKPALQIVRFCGGDPDTMTAKGMDALNVRLVQGSAIMTWRAAVAQQMRFNYDMSSWRVADKVQIAKAKECEAKVVQSQYEWICNKCTSGTYASRSTIGKHLEDFHKVTNESVKSRDLTAVVPPDHMYASGIFMFALPNFELLHLFTRRR
ncbi:hypothetical protein DAEQUDRAFT_730873 [Daedalea quercina L-15889]|uniref:F-box domain-containing protein n=1 Tax=Daedalea quercina L-15889 TaxID=1314783 RepID=A0A165MPF5_9APHY|nr:hypothetical protein DAEQUDRAFT_730873 [Daedalea quercina L-15889]